MLETVQSLAVRFVCNLRGICSITEARKRIDLSTLEERRVNSRQAFLLNVLAGLHHNLQSAFLELQMKVVRLIILKL